MDGQSDQQSDQQSDPPAAAGATWAAPDSVAPGSTVGRTAARAGASVTPPRASRPVALPVPLRPMTLADVIDGAFEIIKRRPAITVTLAAIFVVPLQVLVAYLQRDFFTDFQEFMGNSAFLVGNAQWSDDGAALVSVVGGFVVTPLVGGAIAAVVSGWYAGNDPTVKDALAAVGRRLPALLAGGFLVSAGVFVGTLLCFFPGFLAGALFVAVVPIIVVEGAGPIVAMRRSWRLVARRFWPIVLVVFVADIVGAAVSLALSAIPTIGAFFLPESSAWMLYSVGSSISSLLITLVEAGVGVLIYLDLRIRSEGLDLELRATEQFATA